MKRLISSALTVLAISSLAGCCCPGPMMPWGGACGMQPAFPGGGAPSGQMTYDGMQSATPVWTSPVAMPMQTYPTVALESLPTYR